jgi:hypothetical protein
VYHPSHHGSHCERLAEQVKSLRFLKSGNYLVSHLPEQPGSSLMACQQFICTANVLPNLFLNLQATDGEEEKHY